MFGTARKMFKLHFLHNNSRDLEKTSFYCDIVTTFINCQSCLASLRMVSSLRKLTDCVYRI